MQNNWKEEFDPIYHYTVNQQGEPETVKQMMDRFAREATCKHGINLHVMSCGLCFSKGLELIKSVIK